MTKPEDDNAPRKRARRLKVTVSPQGDRGYQITWIDPASGKRKFTSRHTEHEARQFAARVEAEMENAKEASAKVLSIDVQGDPRTAGYWLDLLGAFASRIAENPVAEDLQRASKAVAALAAAARNYVEVADGEDKLKELEALVTKLRRGEKYGLADPFVQSTPPAH